HAEASVAKFNGHGYDGAGLHLGFFVDLAEEARFLRGVGNDHHFAVLRHPAANSLAEFNAHILECLRGFAYRQLEIEFLLGFVEQQERPVLRAQKFVDFLNDRSKNLIELQGGSERLPQFLEDRHFARFSLFGRCAWIAAPLDTWKLLDLLSAHRNLSPGRQQPAPATRKRTAARRHLS